MMYIIQDSNPATAVNLLPDSIKFKQLIELMQLLSSVNLTNVYKPVKQGKLLKEWILNNKEFTLHYFTTLTHWCFENVNLTSQTIKDINTVLFDLYNKIDYVLPVVINNIPFRCSKNYTEGININNKLLPIEEGTLEYIKYVKWKVQNKIWRI